METSRPTIGITMGDPCGIGAEIIVKALAEEAVRRRARFVIFGLAEQLSYTADALERGFRFFRDYPEDIRPYPHELVVLDYDEIAIPAALIAKLFRVPIVYIECGAQVARPSVTGRVLYWLANAFFVQWPELLDVYGPRAQYRGSLVDDTPPEDVASREGGG